MKEIKLPAELVKLPHPWGLTDSTERYEQLETLKHGSDEIETALDVLNRCLRTLSRLSPPSIDSIPESLMQYWDFSAEWLAETMPTFDDFEVMKVCEQLKQYEIDSPSANLIEQLSSYWLWWVTRDIYRATLSWLRDALREAGESPPATRFLSIVRHYYWQVDESIKQSLLLASASIGWQKALPLLNSVEHNHSTSPQLRQAAQDYQQWINGSKTHAKTKRALDSTKRPAPQFALAMAARAGD